MTSLRCKRCGRLLGKVARRGPPGGSEVQIVCPDSRCHAYNAYSLTGG